MNLTEETARQLFNYVSAAAFITTGRHDWRIPGIVADQWSRTGRAIISHNDLARRFQSTRRTICQATKRLIESGFIREIGRTDDGRAVYAPCLEKGAEWRRFIEERTHGIQ